MVTMDWPGASELQGDDIATAPNVTGIYAWYYRPRIFYETEKDGVAEVISQFMNTRTRLQADVRIRYGLRLHGEAALDMLYGSGEVPAAEVISEAVAKVG